MKFEIDVQRRDRTGKGIARQLRREGRIPAVLYSQGKSTAVSMDPKLARNILVSQVGHTGLLTVRIAGGKAPETKVAVLQDHQVDPITGAILHVDLFEVSMDRPIRVKVPVSVVGGVPVGVKEGGILHQPLRELHIECLPGEIPDHVEVDASGLGIGQGVHVQDMPIPQGVKVLDGGEAMVVHVTTKISEAKLESLLAREVPEGPGEAVEPSGEAPKPQEGGATAPAEGKEGKK